MKKGGKRKKSKNTVFRMIENTGWSETLKEAVEEEVQRMIITEARKAIGMEGRPLEEIIEKLETDPEAWQTYKSVWAKYGRELPD